MTRPARPLVLLGAAVVMLLGLFVGFRLLTAEADTTVDGPQCVDRTVKTGDQLTSNLVKVNVYNVSQRSGLANRVSINLQRRGFLAGEIGNIQTKIRPGRATIVTNTPDDPQVLLVAAQLKGVKILEPDTELKDGVSVIIGDAYDGLKKGAERNLTVSQPVTVCVPDADVDVS